MLVLCVTLDSRKWQTPMTLDVTIQRLKLCATFGLP